MEVDFDSALPTMNGTELPHFYCSAVKKKKLGLLTHPLWLVSNAKINSLDHRRTKGDKAITVLASLK